MSLFVLFLGLSSCKIEAEPIEYGHDQCHYCKMNIVDREHASQYVTPKGKQFKFDAIECMVNDLRDNPKTPAILLVSDYGQSQMTPAKAASYLISPEIQSPMGANLSGFATKVGALKIKEEHGGKIYTWDELQKVVSKQIQ